VSPVGDDFDVDEPPANSTPFVTFTMSQRTTGAPPPALAGAAPAHAVVSATDSTATIKVRRIVSPFPRSHLRIHDHPPPTRIRQAGAVPGEQVVHLDLAAARAPLVAFLTVSERV